MTPNHLILALMTFTIGGLLVISVLHFGWHLTDKKNRDAAKAALIGDDSSAHTAVRGGSTPEHLKGSKS